MVSAFRLRLRVRRMDTGWESITRTRSRKRLNGPERSRGHDRGGCGSQVFVEELQNASFVFVASDVKRLVVFGLVDDPELLGLRGEIEEAAGHVGLDVRVAATVDHEEWPAESAQRAGQ